MSAARVEVPERRQAQPVQLEGVRRGDAGPAGVGQDGHAAPAGERAPGQGPGPLEHLLGRTGPDHAGLLEGSVESGFAPR